MLRTEQGELLKHGFQADGIELGFEAKTAKPAFEFEHFQFAVGQYSG